MDEKNSPDSTGSSEEPTLPQEEPGTVHLTASPAEGAGTVIGNYKLLEKLGEGGFGVVYLAEQTEPIRRKVALKIIKLGMDTKEVVARFEAERQALGLMDHPNVAQVYDAGATDTGRPYFVMELVKGVPITDYCDKHKLPIQERLVIFMDVCRAVQHAHQKGIIHRDLKPSNVLIAEQEDKPVPKVIDFGVAKAVSMELTEKTLFTMEGQMIGTPQYMSPEQAGMGGIDIDTRSDIYSLGVLLYELLTGTTPLEPRRLREAGFAAIEKLIQEEESPKPSTRITTLGEELSTTAQVRKVEPAKLKRLVQGDLDWIVMKALEKDRSRRYESATGLAADIQHHLTDESVQASPPSISYRLRKFGRRYRAALATAALVFAVLVAGVVVSVSQAIRALEAREAEAKQRELAEDQRHLAEANALKAQEAAEEAKAVLAFFRDKVLSAARPKGQRGGLGIDVTIREAVDVAEPQIEKAFGDRPLVEASIRSTLGSTYNFLGEGNAAISQNERAFELREKLLGPEHPATLSSMNNLAISYGDAGRLDEALELREETLELKKKVLGPEYPTTLGSMTNLANSYWDAGRVEKALALREETLELKKKVLGPEHPDTLIAMTNLASSRRDAGRFDESLELNEEVLELSKKVLGPEHPATLLSMNNLAISYANAGRNDEALALREETLELRTKVLGREHPDTLSAMGSLANSYRDAARFDEALALNEETLELREKVLGPEHPDTLISMTNLANSYWDAGRVEKALALREETLDLQKKVLGPEHQGTVLSMANLAVSYRGAGRLDEAVTLSEETLELRKEILGPQHPHTLTSMNSLALCYGQVGRHEEALALQEKTLELQRKVLGPERPSTLGAMTNLANSYHKAGRREEAIALQKKSLAIKRRVLPPGHPFLPKAITNLAKFYEEEGRNTEAQALRKELAELKAGVKAKKPATK